VFFIAAGSFIYFRFYTDVREDRAKFRNLRKIGLTRRETRRIVTLQLAILFFIPFAVAALHSAFALRMLQTRMAASIGGPAALVLALFFAALILYFLMLRSRYLRSLLED
jgi:putative ABC transport system permease protein